MRICYFGIYNPDYPRNRNIIKGLMEAGVSIIQVNDRSKGFRKYVQLLLKHWRVRHDYDVMIVGFSGQIVMPLARLLTRKPIFFDAHVSLYDSDVTERKKFTKRSFRGVSLYVLDWVACRLAYRVLLDTKSHVQFFCKLFHLTPAKFIVVYTGVDVTRYKSLINKDKSDTFIVEFHGLITPTNAMHIAIQAMKLLSDIKLEFWIIGGGSEYDRIRQLALKELKLKNIIFFPFMPWQELLKKISIADIGLGFFNNAGRATRVIANKVYELMALHIPVVTADTIALRELFEHKKNIYLCDPCSPSDLAAGIRELRDDISYNDTWASKKIGLRVNKRANGITICPENPTIITS